MRGTRRVRFTCLFALAVAACALPAAAGAATFDVPGFEEQTVASGLTQPLAVDWTPDGRMLVAEKAGVLKVVPVGSTTGIPILDISGHVNTNGERGLLGMAVDSEFTRNHYVYLLYTNDVTPGTPDSTGAMASRLTRVRLNNDNTVTGPETILLGEDSNAACPATPANGVDCIPSDSLSHSIGTVRSARDGTLWVSTGEGAEYNFADSRAFRAYNEASPGGKILHVDRSGNGLPGHPFCPSDANLDDVCTKVYAKGFRNPFRFTLGPAGGLVVGDVGWNTEEEIDLIGHGGGNYGWPCYEGSVHTPDFEDMAQCKLPDGEYANEGTAGADIGPLFAYPHNHTTHSVLGGPFYLGDEYPAGYRGSIFFGDFTGGTMERLVPDGAGGMTAEPFATDWTGVDLISAPSGNLVYADVADFGTGNGSIKRIVYGPGNGAPHATVTASPDHGRLPLQVKLSASGSHDPDDDPVTYRWSFGDGSPGATGASVSHSYPVKGKYTVTLTVDDGRGKTGRATRQIDVTAPPSPAVDPGPRISFTGLSARKGMLSGRASDSDGVAKVYVALGRRAHARGKCRWWFTSVRRLSRGLHRCSRPHWIRAKLVKGKWKASLRRHRIPAGAYRVIFKALDKRGNETTKLKDGRSLVRVRVHRRR